MSSFDEYDLDIVSALFPEPDFMDYFDDDDDVGLRRVPFNELSPEKRLAIITKCNLSGRETPAQYEKRHNANLTLHSHQVAKREEKKVIVQTNFETGVPPVVVNIGFQQALREARATSGLTQKALAAKLSVTPNILAAWENVNQTTLRPTPTQIRLLNQHLSCVLPKLPKAVKVA